MSGPETSLEEAAGILATGGTVVFTGSGISAESGIPTFRDPGGIWDRFDPSTFGTWGGLMREAMARPDALAAFLLELRRVLGAAKPGPAHTALGRLEAAGVVDAVVTQNVDGLHQAAGTRRIVELHGSFARAVCLVCGHPEDVGDRFLVDLDRAIVALRSAFVPSLASVLPRCRRCGGPARPDFVAFGEAVRGYPDAEILVRGCRALLVVGTSGEVFPAAQLPVEARLAGAVVIEVATERTSIDADLRLEGPAGTLLPALADRVLAGR